VHKGLPGKIGTHYRVGTVRRYTLRGYWRYLEHDWVAKSLELLSTSPRRGPRWLSARTPRADGE
jgi:hypothetical protein